MDQQRYKKRGLQFNSAVDSRALRAVQYRERRKSRRNDVISLRRQMDSMEDSMDKGRPSQSMGILLQGTDEKLRKTQKELGLERYQQLLRWKDQKRKHVEKEKKRRRPSFKTGVYHPDPPKYLVSGDVVNMGQSLDQIPGKTTPFKFLLSSSKKYGTTPGASLQKKPVFHTGVTPGTAVHRIPRFCTGVTPVTSVQRVSGFNTGVTPNELLKRERILGSRIHSKKELEKSEMKENYGARRTRASLKRTCKAEHIVTETRKVLGRTARKHKYVDAQDDLGVKQLPATPQPTRAILQRERSAETLQPSEAHVVSSFAPSDFGFDFDMSKVSSTRDILPDDDNSSDSCFAAAATTQRHRRSTRFFKSALDIDSSYQTSSNAASEYGKISGDPQQEVNLEVKDEISENEFIIERNILENENDITTEKDRTVINSETSKEDEVLEEYETEEQAVKEGPQNERKTLCTGGPIDVESIGMENLNSHGNTKAGKEDIDIEKENKIAKENMELDECTNFDSNVTDAHDDQTVECRAKKVDGSKRHSNMATPAKCCPRKSVSCCGDYFTPSMSRLRPRTPCSRNTRRSLSAHCDPPSEIITRSSKKASSKKSSRRSANNVVKHSNISKVLSEESVLKYSLSESEIASKNVEAENEVSVGTENQMDKEEKLQDVTTEAQEQFVTPIREELLMDTKSELTSEPSEMKNSSPLIVTPRSRGHRSKVSWMIDASPFIDKSRRSANKIRSCATPDFQKLPDEIPKGGSPDLANQMPLSDGPRKFDDPVVLDVNQSSPEIESKVSEDQTCMKLLPILEPSSPACHLDSPGSPDLANQIPLSDGPRNFDDPVVLDVNQGSPEIESKVSEDQTCMKLLPLLEPSSPACHLDSPDIDVWGVVSPAMPSSTSDSTAAVPVRSRSTTPETLTTLKLGPAQEIGLTPSPQTDKMLASTAAASKHKILPSALSFNHKTPTTLSMQSIQTELAVPAAFVASSECKENEKPFDQSLLSNNVLPGKNVGGKRKSRRSVMFTLKEQENDAAPNFRFPGTPIRSSSRVSMGLFSKVDLTTDSLFPCYQDLIDLDSPKSEKKTAATRKRSSRVSLLPGMKSSPVAVQESPVTQDLIKWDTPMEPKKRNSRKSTVSSFATPSRRSRRLSKAPVL